MLLTIMLLAGLAADTARPLTASAGEAAPSKSDLIGVNGNAFPWEPHWNTFLSLLNQSNAGWARVELRWDYINPALGTWQWGLLDDQVNGYAGQGIHQLGLLDYSVGWANGQGNAQTVFGPPTDLDAWEAYVRATVERYHDRVGAWEIWNEPDVAFFWNGQDGGDPAVYTELLRRAHRAIKSVDPNAVVMNGGVTGTERGASFLNRVLDLDGGEYLDAIAIHGYVPNDGLDTSIYPEVIWPLISKVRERAGKPLWVTEFGWSSGCGAGGSVACSEAAQANRIARHLPMLFSIGGVEHVLLFLFKDPGNQPNYFGLTDADGRTKPAYTAFATMAGRLAGLRFERRVEMGDSSIWSMRFSNGDRTVDIIWSQTGSRQIWLPTASASVRTWKIDGSSADVNASSGGVSLSIGLDPLIVERDGRALSSGASTCRYFPETNQSLCDSFLTFWERYGGLMMFGYPISAATIENGKTVQYLERSKFEYQPEAAGTDWEVVGELLGRTITVGREHEQPFQRVSRYGTDGNCQFFDETGHGLCWGFRAYWQEHGGLWMFGYPISEEFEERNPDSGEVYKVQYFERARFEWHPDNQGTPYAVLLGRLGAQLYDKRY
ncbi:MAG TPA: glycosyl hydrolase [Thermomicrobiales bacterium]|nr:glycosyl hydrolase [Thermomicrobiales bacterium]